MLAVARHQAILDALQRERVVRVSDLAQQLGVSLMTVRRDIEVLEEGGRNESTAARRSRATPAPTSPVST
jgi:DeoR family glycerol-3-phosphate regulon repressor